MCRRLVFLLLLVTVLRLAAHPGQMDPFVGLGIGLDRKKTTGPHSVGIIVTGSPADRAGVKIGDVITAVGERSCDGLSPDEALGLLRGGKLGDEIKLTLRSAEGPRELSLTYETISGRRISGDCTDGEGEWLNIDGSVYRGPFKSGRFHGRGRFQCREGIYEGDFAAGRITGTGKWDYANGNVYEGAVVAGNPEGRGALVLAAKQLRLEGNFVAGKGDGPMRVVFLDSKGVLEADFSAGNMTAARRLTLADGRKPPLQPSMNLTDIAKLAAAPAPKAAPARTLGIDPDPPQPSSSVNSRKPVAAKKAPAFPHPEKITCAKCSGNGYVPSRCGYCQAGQSLRDFETFDERRIVNGKVVHVTVKRPKKCIHCDGSGFNPWQCLACGGSGQVRNPAR